MSDVTDALGCGIDTRKATNKLIKLRNYLNKELPDKKAKAKMAEVRRQRDEMFAALIRINNWCAQDLAENAFTADTSGNYLKTLNGLGEICKPFAKMASRLKEYGGTEDGLG